jgi:hypothetical protein
MSEVFVICAVCLLVFLFVIVAMADHDETGHLLEPKHSFLPFFRVIITGAPVSLVSNRSNFTLAAKLPLVFDRLGTSILQIQCRNHDHVQER